MVLNPSKINITSKSMKQKNVHDKTLQNSSNTLWVIIVLLMFHIFHPHSFYDFFPCTASIVKWTAILHQHTLGRKELPDRSLTLIILIIFIFSISNLQAVGSSQNLTVIVSQRTEGQVRPNSFLSLISSSTSFFWSSSS